MKLVSFIFNSDLFSVEPAYRRDIFRFVKKLGFVIGALAVFELLAHAFTPAVHPLQAPSDQKEALYIGMLKDDKSYDVVMVGSSMTQSGFDPDTFDPLFGSRSFNAGIAGRSNSTWQLEMIREIIAAKKPKILLYAIESWSLSADQHVATPKVARTQMFQFLTLFQNRERINDWLVDAVFGHFSVPPAFVAQDSNFEIEKRFAKFTSQTIHPNGFLEVDAIGRPDFHGVQREFRVFAWQAKALNEIMKIAREANVTLIFVQLPEFSGEIARAHGRQEAFRKYMHEQVMTKGFRYMDFNFDIPFPRDNIELYYDTNHLNARGARLFTTLLANQLLRCCAQPANYR